MTYLESIVKNCQSDYIVCVPKTDILDNFSNENRWGEFIEWLKNNGLELVPPSIMKFPERYCIREKEIFSLYRK
jgi:hypothetical protein